MNSIPAKVKIHTGNGIHLGWGQVLTLWFVIVGCILVVHLNDLVEACEADFEARNVDVSTIAGDADCDSCCDCEGHLFGSPVSVGVCLVYIMSCTKSQGFVSTIFQISLKSPTGNPLSSEREMRFVHTGTTEASHTDSKLTFELTQSLN